MPPGVVKKETRQLVEKQEDIFTKNNEHNMEHST